VGDLVHGTIERVWLALDGFVLPLILRTYCRAAAFTSSAFAAGSKL